jgi:hypothetical protein
MNFKYKTKPYAHQETALEKSWDKIEYGYFMEMGTGKSKVLVDNMAMLYDKGKINGALIIAPKGVYNNWYTSEIPTHLSNHIKPKVVLWTSNKKYGENSIVQYYGAIDSKTRQDGINKFQNINSPVKFFIGNPQTGGYGITLTAANTVIYYSNGYDLEKRLQSEDRAHRIGQKKSVTYVDLIAEKTIDEKIVKALRKKINIASEVMGDTLKDWI